MVRNIHSQPDWDIRELCLDLDLQGIACQYPHENHRWLNYYICAHDSYSYMT